MFLDLPKDDPLRRDFLEIAGEVDPLIYDWLRPNGEELVAILNDIAEARPSNVVRFPHGGSW